MMSLARSASHVENQVSRNLSDMLACVIAFDSAATNLRAAATLCGKCWLLNGSTALLNVR